MNSNKDQPNRFQINIKNFFKKIENMLFYNKGDLNIFAEFLLYDLISKNEIERLKIKDDTLLLSKIINNPEPFFEKYFSEIYRINNVDEKISEIIKKKIIVLKKNIEKKIDECNKDMTLLQEIYSETKIYQKIPFGINHKSYKMSGKTVLHFHGDEKMNYLLGEIMARYLFVICQNDKNSNDVILEKSKQERFYENIIDFNDSDSFYDNFDSYNILTKYWYVYVLIIKNMFMTSSDYDFLFDEESNTNVIKKLLSFGTTNKGKEKDDEKRKKEKEKELLKSLFGGGILNLKKKINNKIKKQVKKISENKKSETKYSKEKNEFIQYLKNIIITKETNEHKKINITFYSIFYSDKFKKIIYDFYDKIINNEQKINTNTTIPNYFIKDDKSKDIKISSITKKTEKKEILQELKNNFDIFQELNVFQKDKDKLISFIQKIKTPFIYLIYSLYSIKKNIYSAYIESMKNVLQLKNNNPKKNKNSKNSNNDSKDNEKNKHKKEKKKSHGSNDQSDNESNNSKYFMNARNYNNYNTNDKKIIIYIEKKIDKLKKEKQHLVINSMGNYNSDAKILEINQLINKLILKKQMILKKYSDHI